ncbi:MAG: VCBS repeat-containing protein [Deltaproteobacteria bacterium]|nr:VCBS repeat-containing protein [Deltaproteobacteria bacterium]
MILSPFAIFLGACSGSPEPAPAAPPPAIPAAAGQVEEALLPDRTHALVLSIAWFEDGPDGKPKPGPARLQFWQETPRGWEATRLEDPDSNVFHKALPHEGALLTIGGEKALLKRRTWDGTAWHQETLWSRTWGGRFNRLRDLEVGDVDGDGRDEFVMATHDHGVVAVMDPEVEGRPVTELDPQSDTFVHEIEIGDVDGDGRNEFFATPSARNRADASQKGAVVMYRWDGSTYVRSFVEQAEDTHAKEILAHDVDGDGKSELFVVLEAALGPAERIVKPVEIRLYRPGREGRWTHEVVATIQDRQTRFLVPGDFDGDGEVELVASAMKTGVWILDRKGKAVEGPWTATCIDPNSGGYEHAAVAADLDGDGTPEIYVASDDQEELVRYAWNAPTTSWGRTRLGRLSPGTITWNVAVAPF